MSSAAQQLLCACITADMRSPNTCCASGYQLLGDIFYITSLSSVRRSDGFAIRSREIVICYVLGDYKSPGLIGRTFFYDGFQIRRDAWRGCGTAGGRISNPSGRQGQKLLGRCVMSEPIRPERAEAPSPGHRPG